MRVYFDASVLIAALLSATGGSARLLEYVKFPKRLFGNNCLLTFASFMGTGIYYYFCCTKYGI